MASIATSPLANASLLAFAAIGVLFLLNQLAKILRMLISLFVLPGIPLRSYGPPGSWAVITGASDGLGAEYARQLARNKFNLLLLSRTASKLHTLSTDIHKSYPGTQIRIHAMDFAQDRDEDYQLVDKLTEDVKVAILVNNVGVSHRIPVPFTETPLQELRDIVAVNIMATLRMTQVIAPKMVANKRGLVLNMASFGGMVPTPLLATYSGSKAFLQEWSSAAAAELASSGVRVQLIQSYLVTSAMSKIRRPSPLVPTPQDFVTTTLSKIGRGGGCWGNIAYTSTPYWSHAFLQWFTVTFFEPTGLWVLKQNLASQEAIRKRALKKLQNQKKAA